MRRSTDGEIQVPMAGRPIDSEMEMQRGEKWGEGRKGERKLNLPQQKGTKRSHVLGSFLVYLGRCLAGSSHRLFFFCRAPPPLGFTFPPMHHVTTLQLACNFSISPSLGPTWTSGVTEISDSGAEASRAKRPAAGERRGTIGQSERCPGVARLKQVRGTSSVPTNNFAHRISCSRIPNTEQPTSARFVLDVRHKVELLPTQSSVRS